MTDLNINATQTTPGVSCTPGKITMKGKSLSPGTPAIFDAVEEWFELYVKHPEQLTKLDLVFEYIDANSTRSLYNLLKYMIDESPEECSIEVNWHYDVGDIEMIQLGEVIQGRLGLQFDFVELLQ